MRSSVLIFVTISLSLYSAVSQCAGQRCAHRTVDSESCDALEGFSPEPATFHSFMSNQSERHYDAGSGSWIKVLDKSSLTSPTGAEIKMQFAELYAAPGDIRETHWHINSGEWAYVKAGKCDFTLMGVENRFSNIRAVEGDVWYFPAGWQHYFQAVDPNNGCHLLLWFDTSDVNMDITNTIGQMPCHVIQQSFGNMPELIVKSMKYPLYEAGTSPTGVHSGAIPDDLNEECKGARNSPCNPSLMDWPTFPMGGAIRTETPGAGVQFLIRNSIFPAARTMSGARLEMQSGTIRELHWHPNAEEHIYVGQGTIRMAIHGVDQDTRKQLVDSFELSAGDIAVVPMNFNHYIEALEDDTIVIVAFNTPNMIQQGLSATLLTTPKHITATTLDIGEDVINEFFPNDTTPFIPPFETDFK